jgi:hypothetical protein
VAGGALALVAGLVLGGPEVLRTLRALRRRA